MGQAPEPSKPRPIRVILDGQPIELPLEGGWTLPEILAHLERLAVNQERLLSAIAVDGVALQAPGLLPTSLASVTRFQRIEASSISFEERAMEVVERTLQQTRRLLQRSDAAQLLILINDWPVVRQIWQTLVPQFKSPLMALSFLHELWGEKMAQFKVGQRSFREHCDAIGGIQAEIELMLELQRDRTELSDILEQKLIPWLLDLETLLTRLRQYRPPDL